jgi:ABC-type Na+ efflux pump permease subunit
MNKGLITKMIIVAILGIAVIAVVVGMMFTPEKEEKRPAQSLASGQTDNNVTEAEENAVVEIERMLALVKAIDSKNNVLTVYDIERELTINLVIDSTVIFEDEYGTMLVADQLLPGYIVNVKYDKNSFIPIQVKVAPQIQTISKLSSFILNEELKTIQIGSDIYFYNEELIAFDREKKLALSEITEADDVIIRAYKNIIWSIIREKGHGYIVSDKL